ncbi:OB-fold domain-containing protein [Nocardioides ferulae]|uniref:OB-fold domain-containing protein n=1 Tax=Nocardioides ferulae TaxID=2340821 RepID=UPI000EAFE8DF|nr:OB-fold domain-containing protein [Nocardioides ferulae]
MSRLTAIGTVLPGWSDGKRRVVGLDEDAVTLGVAAARVVLEKAGTVPVDRVVFVSHDLPLLEGGNAAPLLAGIGLDESVVVVEQVGGAPAVLDAVAGALPGTLVIAADLLPAGAGAVLVGETGPELSVEGRVVRSMPTQSRAADGIVREYDDPRLLWEQGVRRSIEQLELTERPTVVAGLAAKQARQVCSGTPPELPVIGGAAAVFALAAIADPGGALVLAVEQANITAARVDGVPTVASVAPEVRPLPRTRTTPGPDIAISLAAYDRAFEPKLRWEAGSCDACGTLALPPRLRCLECGSEEGWSLVPLPRTGEVYTGVTVHVPVPGLPTPYSLVIVQLDDVDVRALVKVTGVEAGAMQIGDRGTLVFRRISTRTGIPDYGYAFLPEADVEAAQHREEASA